MCNYCGCRAIEPIAELNAEHERILNLRGDLRRAVARGDEPAAVEVLRELRTVLALHDTVEELAVYPAMERLPEFTDKVGTLFDEHDDTDDVLDAALAAAGRGDPVRWDGVLGALDVLAEHIDHEEHGLFPAAAVSLDPADWELAAKVRADHAAT